MSALLSLTQQQHAQTLLRQGAQDLGIGMNSAQLQQLLTYLQQLLKWNKAYNLTAIKDYQQMVSLHLLDSLAIVPYVQKLTPKQRPSLLDVGTGAGLPGVVLAIMLPHWHITLLDSNGKKMRFLFHIKSLLQLPIALVNERAEAYHAQQYDFISTRAFAALDKIVASCTHLLHDDGCFIAMKGQYPQAELDAAMAQQAALKLEQSIKLQVPNESVERHLLVLKLN